MKKTGRMMTSEEAKKVRFPFSENKGDDWNPDLIRTYVEKGAEKIRKDKDKMKSIMDGLEELAK